jgi:hypothetical protein
MRSNSYYKVRRVVRAIFWLSLFAGIYLISTRIWWNESGLCIGNMEVCGL